MNTLVAWATGVFEGEGSIITKGKSSVVLKIDMTDRDILERIKFIFGGQVYDLNSRRAQDKPVYRWQVSVSEESVKILELMEPYLGVRRSEKAAEAREHYQVAVKRHERYRQLVDAVRKLYAEGLTEQKIADELGTSRSNVSMIKKNNGLTHEIIVKAEW